MKRWEVSLMAVVEVNANTKSEAVRKAIQENPELGLYEIKQVKPKPTGEQK